MSESYSGSFACNPTDDFQKFGDLRIVFIGRHRMFDRASAGRHANDELEFPEGRKMDPLARDLWGKGVNPAKSDRQF